MVDSFTDNRNIIQPLVGGDSGTWGGLLNSGISAQLDLILGATQAITITIADVNLTIPQWNNCAIKLTGVLTGNRSLVLPLNVNSATVAVGGYFVVDNQTTGAFNVTVKTIAAGSTGVTVPQGKRTWLYSDKTNVYYADDSKVQLLTGSGTPNGSVAGTAGSINNPPSLYWDYTNAQLYFCITTGTTVTAVWTVQQATISRGFDAAVNLQLSVTHTGGNLLNVAVKTTAGTDPTAVSPVICEFQTLSGTATTGAVTSVSVAAALSMTSNAAGATLGSINNAPFRIWVALFNNAGTAVLAVLNASTSAGVFPVAEQGVASTVGISGAATSAGVWYTPNGTTLTSKAYRLIGYCEYTSGLATAGTYTTDPSNVVLFGPGVRKPGDVIQKKVTTTTGTTSIGSTSATATALAAAFSLGNNCNPVQVMAFGFVGIVNPTAQQGPYFNLYRNTGAVTVGNTSNVMSGPTAGGGGYSQPTVNMALDAPAASNWPPTQYGLYGALNTGTTAWTFLGGVTTPPPTNNGAIMIIEEIMG